MAPCGSPRARAHRRLGRAPDRGARRRVLDRRGDRGRDRLARAGEIPALLRQDGSPPLYYLLLHAWIGVFGDGEAAARSLSLLFAALAVPAAWWAANASPAPRGAVAAAVVAVCPFFGYYAQEARMYTLVAVLSLVAAAAFVQRRAAGHPRAPRSSCCSTRTRGASSWSPASHSCGWQRRRDRAGAITFAVVALAVPAVGAEPRVPGAPHRRAVVGILRRSSTSCRRRSPWRGARATSSCSRAPPGSRSPGSPRRSSPRGRRATPRSSSGRCCSVLAPPRHVGRRGAARRDCSPARPSPRATPGRSPPASRRACGPATSWSAPSPSRCRCCTATSRRASPI